MARERKSRYKAAETISDETLLELIVSGVLTVDINSAECSRDGRPLKATVVGTAGRNGTRYRFEIRSKGKKRSILRSRLVYLAGTGKPIPDGFEIHHIDGNRYNDSFSNLVAVSRVDHSKLHCLYKPPGAGDGIPY